MPSAPPPVKDVSPATRFTLNRPGNVKPRVGDVVIDHNDTSAGVVTTVDGHAVLYSHALGDSLWGDKDERIHTTLVDVEVIASPPVGFNVLNGPFADRADVYRELCVQVAVSLLRAALDVKRLICGDPLREANIPQHAGRPSPETLLVMARDLLMQADYTLADGSATEAGSPSEPSPEPNPPKPDNTEQPLPPLPDPRDADAVLAYTRNMYRQHLRVVAMFDRLRDAVPDVAPRPSKLARLDWDDLGNALDALASDVMAAHDTAATVAVDAEAKAVQP